MRANARKAAAVLIVAAGACLMFYPWFSNWLYSHGVDSTVESYEKEVSGTDPEKWDAVLEEARRYNNLLALSDTALTDPFVFAEASDITYGSVLSLDVSGLMCFVEIPKIDVYLPVYHGTSEDTLLKGAGHLEGTSVPVGGEGTHAVLAAHTGINSSKMFTDLTEMEEGDLFFIHVLDDTLAYRVCDIQVILPEKTESLRIEDGRDLVTLLTCTPYGVNSHRLTVTGERTEYTEEVQAEAGSEETDTGSQWMKAYRRALLAGLVAVAVTAVSVKIIKGSMKKREDAD